MWVFILDNFADCLFHECLLACNFHLRTIDCVCICRRNRVIIELEIKVRRTKCAVTINFLHTFCCFYFQTNFFSTLISIFRVPCWQLSKRLRTLACFRKFLLHLASLVRVKESGGGTRKKSMKGFVKLDYLFTKVSQGLIKYICILETSIFTIRKRERERENELTASSG